MTLAISDSKKGPDAAVTARASVATVPPAPGHHRSGIAWGAGAAIANDTGSLTAQSGRYLYQRNAVRTQ